MAQKNFTLVTLATAATAATAGQKEFKKLILREPSRTVCHKEGGNIFCGTKLISKFYVHSEDFQLRKTVYLNSWTFEKYKTFIIL